MEVDGGTASPSVNPSRNIFDSVLNKVSNNSEDSSACSISKNTDSSSSKDKNQKTTMEAMFMLTNSVKPIPNYASATSGFSFSSKPSLEASEHLPKVVQIPWSSSAVSKDANVCVASIKHELIPPPPNIQPGISMKVESDPSAISLHSPTPFSKSTTNLEQGTSNAMVTTANVIPHETDCDLSHNNLPKNTTSSTQISTSSTENTFSLQQSAVKCGLSTVVPNPISLTSSITSTDNKPAAVIIATDGTILERLTAFPTRKIVPSNLSQAAPTVNLIPYDVPPPTVNTLPISAANINRRNFAVNSTFPRNIIPLKCKFCEYMCATEEVLSLHLSQHQKEFQYQTCPITRCKFRYCTKDDIVKHYQELHDDPAALQSCIDCVFMAHTDEALAFHREKHFKKRPFACNICFKTFIKMPALRCHNTKYHKDDPRITQDFGMPVGTNSDGDYVADIVTEIPSEIRSSKRKRNQLPKELVCSDIEEDPESEGVHEEAMADVKVKQEAELLAEQPVNNHVDGSMPKTYQLGTSYLYLHCAFCQSSVNSKADLANHLITSHGEEVIDVADALVSS